MSVDPPIISDHSVISATVVFDQTAMAQLSSAPIVRRWTDFDIESFKNDLLKSELICCPPGNCEEFFATYDRTLSELLEKHAPRLRSVRPKRIISPWFNGECRQMKSETRRLEKQYRKNKTAETLKIWRTQFVVQRCFFQQVRRIYWSNTIQGCTDPKSLWRKLNCLLQPSAASVPPHTPNAFATFFKDKTEVIRASTAAARDPDIRRRSVTSFDSFGQFSAEDIADAIRKAPNKQCVIDPVPAWIIKQSSESVTYWFGFYSPWPTSHVKPAYFPKI